MENFKASSSPFSRARKSLRVWTVALGMGAAGSIVGSRPVGAIAATTTKARHNGKPSRDAAASLSAYPVALIQEPETRSWLHKHKRKRGGYAASQLHGFSQSIPRSENRDDSRPRRHTLAFRKLINNLMKNGKRGSVERMLFQCCAFIKRRNFSSRWFIYQAIQNVKPMIELRSNLRKKSSRQQGQRPVPILSRRAEKLALG